MTNYFLTLEIKSMDGKKGSLHTFSSNPLNSNQYLQIKFKTNYLDKMEENHAQ